MSSEINPIGTGKDKVAASYASQLNSFGSGMDVSSSQSAQQNNVSSISTSDTVDMGPVEPNDDSEPSNLQALKKIVSSEQGFESGIQPSFAINSATGVQEGLEPGLQAAGVFKPPYIN